MLVLPKQSIWNKIATLNWCWVTDMQILSVDVRLGTPVFDFWQRVVSLKSDTNHGIWDIEDKKLKEWKVKICCTWEGEHEVWIKDERDYIDIDNELLQSNILLFRRAYPFKMSKLFPVFDCFWSYVLKAFGLVFYLQN